MKVSVVICTYSEDLYEHFEEAIESVLGQTYDDIELVLVSDGNEAVYQRTREKYGDQSGIIISRTEENIGVSAARNHGIEIATGDIVAQIDDDAVANPEWIEELVKTYKETNALAVGGRMEGRWVAGKPWYLPDEFNWLVGVTYPGFAEAGKEVRNTFESNISFKRSVFLELGGYNTDFGPDANSYSHSEGAEIGTRLRSRYGRGVVYNPHAVVKHKVFKERISVSHLLKRAFQQGVSKRQMERQLQGDGETEESAYLKRVFLDGIPKYVNGAIRSRSLTPIGEAMMLVVFTVTVGMGYLYYRGGDR